MKGRKYLDYPDAIAKGIVLHREIDRYTDSHPLVGESKALLRDKYRHYSGVIVDIFYDHFLAKNFTSYSEIPLAEFVQNHYQILADNQLLMPEGAQYTLQHMMARNWLLNYAQLDGIQRSLNGMSQRARFDSKMDEATNELKLHYDEFESQFGAFFTELNDHISNFRQELITS